MARENTLLYNPGNSWYTIQTLGLGAPEYYKEHPYMKYILCRPITENDLLLPISVMLLAGRLFCPRTLPTQNLGIQQAALQLCRTSPAWNEAGLDHVALAISNYIQSLGKTLYWDYSTAPQYSGDRNPDLLTVFGKQKIILRETFTRDAWGDAWASWSPTGTVDVPKHLPRRSLHKLDTLEVLDVGKRPMQNFLFRNDTYSAPLATTPTEHDGSLIILPFALLEALEYISTVPSLESGNYAAMEVCCWRTIVAPLWVPHNGLKALRRAAFAFQLQEVSTLQ